MEGGVWVGEQLLLAKSRLMAPIQSALQSCPFINSITSVDFITITNIITDWYWKHSGFKKDQGAQKNISSPSSPPSSLVMSHLLWFWSSFFPHWGSADLLGTPLARRQASVQRSWKVRSLISFYRTWLRSSPTIVNNWFFFSGLDWCDSGCWRFQLKTFWCCCCCCWHWR